ncbi:MAG: hypothetical protein JXA14_08215 [Anaerolineae bacterium]|nr:hypothetical protein [Anaerolineae bacterium]
MTGRIYLLQEDGTLQSLTERHYDSEDLLQGLLARYPDLLAGDQIDETTPRRWLLLCREAGIPVEEDGADHLSLDHLFLDQDGIPTLVEVKRSSDLRIRREVVGQMLDYAAHAVAYWSADALRTRFETTCEAQQQNAAQAITQLLEAEPDDVAAVDAFWNRVKTNLQTGKIRLVFVADEIPRELRRVVEFLNRFMDPTEVLAVEVHQYVGKGLKTLVPRVIGQTVEAQAKKSGTAGVSRQWDKPSFFEELAARHGAEDAAVARAILEWGKQNMPEFYWGRGERSGSFTPGLTHRDMWHLVIVVWTYGKMELQFQHMLRRPPFDDQALRTELLRKFNEIPGINLPADSISRRPSIPLSAFRDPSALDQLFHVLDWFVQQVRST